MTPLAPHLSAFFQQRLPLERRASSHTSESYAYAFKLLLEYASDRLHVRPSALHLEQIDAPLVVAFLNHLETARANRPSSRNVRLAAIKSFMHFLEFREPAAIDQIRCILRFHRRRPTRGWCGT
jgi:integrase/recombinase XerD